MTKLMVGRDDADYATYTRDQSNKKYWKNFTAGGTDSVVVPNGVDMVMIFRGAGVDIHVSTAGAITLPTAGDPIAETDSNGQPETLNVTPGDTLYMASRTGGDVNFEFYLQ